MTANDTEGARRAPPGRPGILLPLAHAIARAAVDAAARFPDKSIDPGRLVDYAFASLIEDVRNRRIVPIDQSTKPRVGVKARSVDKMPPS